MKWKSALKKGIALMGLIAIAAALISVTPAAIHAAPLAQSNLLKNPGMEQPYDGNKSANGWGRWFEDTGKPSGANAGLDYVIPPYFSAELNTAIVRSGGASQHIGNKYEPWHAGLQQAVSNLTPGSTVQFCAYGRLYANNDDFGKSPSISSKDGRMQVGIFPNGDANWATAGIVWSPTSNPHDYWQQICVQAQVGDTGKINVFTSSSYRGETAYHLDAWWDDATLTVLDTGPTPEATAGTVPNAAPTTAPAALPPSVTSTPNPDGSVVHVVQSGDTLFALSLAYNVPVDQIYSLNNLSASSILSIGQNIIMKAGSGGAAAPTATTAPQAGANPTAAAAPTTTVATTSTVQTPATSGATATAAAVAVSSTAKLCVQAFNDVNSDGIMVPGDSPVAGAQFAVASQQGVQVASYTTDGSAQSHCFADLQPGSYTVAVQPASGTVATSDKRWTVVLTSGSPVNVNFGSRSDSGSDSSSAQKSSSGSNLTGLLAGGIGLLALLVAGVLGAVIIARRRG
jgi:LysM repeat protein